MRFRIATPTGARARFRRLSALLDEARRSRHARALRRAMRAARRRGLIGIGIAIYTEPCGHGWESAEVCIEPRRADQWPRPVRARRGRAGRPPIAQIVADALRTRTRRRSLIAHGDTATCPAGIGALASRSTAIGGSALLQAAERFREKARLCAARLLQADPEQVELTAEGFEVRRFRCGACADLARPRARSRMPMRRSWTSSARAAHALRLRGRRRGLGERLLHRDGRRSIARPASSASSGSSGSTMPASSSIRCWREGQMIGGLAQGLGEAMLERIVYDEDGQLVTASFMDYAMPRAVHIAASLRSARSRRRARSIIWAPRASARPAASACRPRS